MRVPFPYRQIPVHLLEFGILPCGRCLEVLLGLFLVFLLDGCAALLDRSRGFELSLDLCWICAWRCGFCVAITWSAVEMCSRGILDSSGTAAKKIDGSAACASEIAWA